MAATQAVVFVSQGQAQVHQVEVPSPGPGELVVGISASAVSVGTEMRIFKGIQEPGQTFPQIPGYANAGTVIEAGEGVQEWLGRRVVAGGTAAASLPRMWGGHCGRVLTTPASVTPLPDSVSMSEGAVTRLGAISYRGFEHAQPQIGDRVLVVGLGVIGQMAARIYRAKGFQVTAVDMSEVRTGAARVDGVEALTISSLSEVKDKHGIVPDIIVDATGSERVLHECIELAKYDPWDDEDHHPTKHVIQGSYPGDFCIPYQEAFLRQLTYLLPRDNQPKDRRAFLALQESKQVTTEGIIREFPLEEAPEVYARCLAGDPECIAPVLLWPG
jgi:2-desacetyl-2-hydroxyethyl bacteriochlorophyllide A dehydrogenase